MANQNFVVHNGLQVGPLTISAATGDIQTTGNVTLSGGGSLAVSQIQKNDSSIAINDSGASSTIVFTIDGAAEGTFNGSGLTLNSGYLNAVGNLMAQTATLSELTVNGNETVTGYLNVTGNVMAGTASLSAIKAGGTTGTSGQVLQSTGTGIQWSSADNIQSGTSSVTVTAAWANVVIASGTSMSVGAVTNGTIVHNNLTVQGNLHVNGTTTTFNSNSLVINDAMIYMADDNTGDVLDIGVVSSFTNPTYQHTGLVRDASDGVWKLFAGVTTEPTTIIDFTSATYSSMKVGKLESTQTTGTAPFTVASTTVVTNLNADLWDGNDFATYLNQAVLTSSSPTFAGVTLPSITHNGTNGVGDIGQTGSRFATIYGLATSAQYADLAEKYVADAAYEPGTVLHFGGEHEVSECNADMCSRVAGVVSTNPAYLMNDTLEAEHVATVALTGRVPCKVTGTVTKGDMMVSAGNGRARAEANPKVGSVIGKALENSEGDAVIEVVVGKH